MPKQQINPGEDCPYCLTTTRPGSTACSGCGETRQYDFVGVKGVVANILKTLLVVVGVMGFIVIGLEMQGSEGVFLAWLYASLFLTLCFLPGYFLYTKYGEYVWVRLPSHI